MTLHDQPAAGKAVPNGGPDLAALVASRICHDLVSPLGAIANGLELIEMTGKPGKPEMALIAESVRDATARVRFLRIALGAAPPGAMIGPEEIRGALPAGGARMTVDWAAAGTLPRAHVKAAFLALACLESACAYGGAATARRDAQGGWTVSLHAERLRIDDALWAIAMGGAAPADLPAAAVQFALLPLAARADLRIDIGPDRIACRF